MFVDLAADVIATIILSIPFLILGALLFLIFGRPFVALRKSPPSDITLIKARLDGEAHRVIEVVRNGSDSQVDRAGAKTWRRYDLVVQYPDGSRVPRTVGVSTSLIFARSLVTYEHGVRKGLWTHHQASLP
jgi:hypothetical protein